MGLPSHVPVLVPPHIVVFGEVDGVPHIENTQSTETNRTIAPIDVLILPFFFHLFRSDVAMVRVVNYGSIA